MKNIVFRWVLLLLFWTPVVVSNAQSVKYPAILAFSREYGFLLDSSEIARSNLFPFISRDNLNYLAIIQTDPTRYTVNVVGRNGDEVNYQYQMETIRNEFEKVAASPQDSSAISDYSTARLYFPETASFILVTSDFIPVEYLPENSMKQGVARFFLDLGTTLSDVAGGVSIFSFQMNGSIVARRLMISLKYQTGESFNDEVVQLYGIFNSVSWKYREFGISSGLILSQNLFFSAISVGVSQIVYSETRYESTGWFTSTKVYDQKDMFLGFPITLDVSIPSKSFVGFSMKAHVTIIQDCRPTYHFGCGIRLGRIY